jgi:phosphinothricin acetyltransferase
MPPLIRAALTADVPAIAAIYGYAVVHGTASWELEPPDAAEMLRRMQALTDAGWPYIIAETDGHLLGYAYASAYRPRAVYRFTCEDSIYIAPDAQGRGIGRLLLTELIARCEAMGLRQMVAVIGDSQSEPSIRLHRAMGFSPAGMIRSAGWKQGRWLDQILMQRVLGAGDASPPALDVYGRQ